MERILKEFDEWLKNNTVLNDRSRKQYVLQINKFLNSYEEVTLDNTRKYLIRGEGVYTRKFAIKYFLQFIEKEEWIEELKPVMKMMKLKDRRYERYIGFQQFKEFLDYLGQKHKKLVTTLMVLWDTGVRVSSIINLRVRDVKKDEKGSYIWVIEKGGKRVKRYLDNYTMEHLNLYLFRKPEDYVFREKVGEKWETWWECYYRMWKLLKTTSRKFLNIGYGISFHWVRTSRAKELYNKYKDVLKVKGFLSHKKIETTMRYIDEGEISSAEIIKEEEGKWEV